MNRTGIKLVEALISGEKESSELLGILGIKSRHLAHVVKGLEESGYVDRVGSTVRMKKSPKTTLFRDIARTANIGNLLGGSNEAVFSSIGKGTTVDGLEKKTGLSRSTVHRAISELRSTGAIIKDGSMLRINEKRGSLALFADVLQLETDKRYEGENVEVIYSDGTTTLRKAPVGSTARGATTGFSLFSEYGVDYYLVSDYFCEQQEDLDMHDVLLHAVYSSARSEDRAELIMCMVFYAKHKDKMDVLELRKRSSKLGISGTWLDIESYMNEGRPRNPELFLPWNEFVAKADMYDVPAKTYSLPEASEIFGKIGGRIDREITAYLFGGENMRIKSLKDRARDCDVAVEDRDDFDSIAQALASIGYRRIMRTEYAGEDTRINPDGIFTREDGGRIDLFASRIMGGMALSSGMKERADTIGYGMLRVGLLRNEDVFLLKAVAGREGDIQDMEALARGSRDAPGKPGHRFEWDIVWSEILEQEEINRVESFAHAISEQIAHLEDHTGIVVPFSAKLRRHVIDRMVERLLRGGSMPIREIVHYLRGGDIGEMQIRNRLDSLEKSGDIKKFSVGGSVCAELLSNKEFPCREQETSAHRLERYIRWRFHTRPGPTAADTDELARELGGAGIKTIGKVDEAVMRYVEILAAYEREQPSKSRLGGGQALRICVGMHHPGFGKKQPPEYGMAGLERYVRTAAASGRAAGASRIRPPKSHSADRSQ